MVGNRLRAYPEDLIAQCVHVGVGTNDVVGKDQSSGTQLGCLVDAGDAESARCNDLRMIPD